MAKKDTQKFLRLMREANEAIAAREAAEKAEKDKKSGGVDEERVRREMERREKLGQLRARPKNKRKGNAHVRNVFGGVNMDPGPND